MSANAPSVFPLGASVAGKRYAVYGLARSGQATVRALFAAGAQVVAWDEKDEARAAVLAQVGSSPARGGGPAQLVEGQASAAQSSASPHLPLQHPSVGPPPPLGDDLSFADPLTIDLTGFDGVVVSPGVPINCHPIADAARAAHVPLISDIELFALARPTLPPHKVVGITGTNGKSTTTALVHHILKTAGVPTTMGGNIGIPILSQPALPEGGVYVLELSSYQIDLTYSLDCDVAVLLNITPDHLDRYDGFAGYAASKARLFEMQSAEHKAVVNWDVFEEGLVQPTAGFNGIGAVDPATQSDWPALQGPHNAQNGAAAIDAASWLGIDATVIANALRTYPGLSHRMERIATVDGVLYVNDSKATNAEAAAPALAAYPPADDGRPRIHWIAGGVAKGEGIGPCEQWLGHIARAYLIGDAAPMLDRVLGDRLPHEINGTLEAAIAAARAHAQPGDVVLLSPAAASFDQFRDFEARGDAFRAMVQALGAKGAGA